MNMLSWKIEKKFSNKIFFSKASFKIFLQWLIFFMKKVKIIAKKKKKNSLKNCSLWLFLTILAKTMNSKLRSNKKKKSQWFKIFKVFLENSKVGKLTKIFCVHCSSITSKVIQNYPSILKYAIFYLFYSRNYRFEKNIFFMNY